MVKKRERMKQPRILFLWTVLTAASVLVPAVGPSAAYEVLTPKQKTEVHSRRAHSYMIIKAAADEAERLQVGRVLNREGETSPVTPVGRWKQDGSEYVHYLLDLQKGVNTFTINPGELDVTIRYQPVRTLLKLDPDAPGVYRFHRSEVVPASCSGCHDEQLPADADLDVETLQRNADYSPVCYSCHRRLTSGDKWLHAPAATVSCMTCHRGDEAGGKVPILTGRVDDTCFSCHINKRKWSKKAYVHGPAATGDCTVCHDPHGGKYPYMLWADPKIDICIVCHQDMEDIQKRQRGFYQHGIILGNGCAACHSPHASDYRFQLGGTINEVCVSCHISMKGMEVGHPVGNHPLSGGEDPRRKGREFSCSSCHNPHGERYKYLLIGSLLGGHVCSKCHH